MTIILTKYNFFQKSDVVFEEEEFRKTSKSIKTSPAVLPNNFLKDYANHKSLFFDGRFTNINYLKNLLSGNDKILVQPVIKIISSANNVKGVKAAVNYIARFAGLKEEDSHHKDTNLYDQDGKLIKDKEEAAGIVREWTKDFKKNQNIMSHMIFSVGGSEEKNKQRSFIATKKFLEDNLKARGYSYFFAAHYDTNNHHFHVIVKKKNKLKENLRFDKHDLFVLRDLYAKNLTAHGIKRGSLARMDNKEVLENIEKRVAFLKERNNYYQSKLTQDSSKDFNAYVYKAKIAGTLENIIKEVGYHKEGNKEMGFFDKNKLNNTLKDLKAFKKEIVQSNSKEQIQKAIELNISYFNKENAAIAKKIDDLINNDNKIKFAYLKQKETGKYLKQIIRKQTAEIDKARIQLKEDLKTNRFSAEEAHIIKQALLYFGVIQDKARKLEAGLGSASKMNW